MEQIEPNTLETSDTIETQPTPTKKPFEQLTITDDYMFKMVMRDPNRVKPLLEMILRKKIRKIVIVETEKTRA